MSMANRKLTGRRVVVVDGCRTPFARSQTVFADLTPYELGRQAVAGLLRRGSVAPDLVDYVVMGTVLADPATSNLAREVGLACGVPESAPAYTVTAACASSNVAIANAVLAIGAGAADVAVVGGAEVLSDPPIRFRRPVRKRLVAAQKARGWRDYLGLLAGLRPSDLLPEIPAIAEFSTGLTMGQTAERMAKQWSIERDAQDTYAALSHLRAAAATAEGRLAAQVEPSFPPPSYAPVASDNGVRADTSVEKLAALPPVFDRSFGTVTAGNSSFLTDGAAACLLMSEERAEALGVEPLAAIVACTLTAANPLDELLLGPVFSIPEALDQAGVALDDVGVVELHEAFAAQVLACLRLLADERFCRDRLGRDGAVGAIEHERVNAWGGSLSIGHPFGATGARLLVTCAHRMRDEGARYGILATCAAGALGNAILLERS
jgi:acetyl-CoA acyltransferase